MDIGESDLSPELIATEGEQRSSTNINDVLQAIEAADPDTFRERAVDGGGAMFGGGVLPGVAPAGNGHQTVPYARIKEQPASKALRFRYECEGRSAGSIPGASSTPEHKTFPTVQVVGYRGRAVVVVSCVTIDKPHKPHPHNLVGKDLCKDGVCTTQLNPDTMEASFSNLGIQCVKKRDIEEALRVREKIRVDPFKTGFAHKTQAQGIDLNAVRLCFQVFLEQDGKFNRPLAPVVSDIIYDKKAMSDLLICRMSHCSASVAGGQEVFLLCEKVAKDDISVVMFETGADGRAVWTAAAEAVAVHKQVAIVFRTPRYHNIHVESAVQGFVQLKRPSDGAVSEARPFELKPMTAHVRKRPRYAPVELSNVELAAGAAAPAPAETIKLEPREPAVQYGHTSPAHNLGSNLNMYRNVQMTPSPPQYHYQGGHNLSPFSPQTGQVYAPQPGQVYAPQPGQAFSPQPGQFSPQPGQYSPQPGPSYSAQQWNIPLDQQQTEWGEAAAGGGGGEEPGASSEFPSIGKLLAGDSLKQLNNSDLEDFSFLPESDVAESFSRLRTDNLVSLQSLHTHNTQQL